MLRSAILAITHFKYDMSVFTSCDEEENSSSVMILKEICPFFLAFIQKVT